MPNEIISYREMCDREGSASLQRGMNFNLGSDYSVILMSLRPNAPYADRFEDDGSTLIYEGHDVPQTSDNPNPKKIDQPELTHTGKLTQNGKFHKAAQAHKSDNCDPACIRVYEKIYSGIWSYNGVFHLVDSWQEESDDRSVFKFKLIAVETDEDSSQPKVNLTKRRRIIPTHVKREVWKRDGGKCVICNANEDLHFDHIIPWSKGGASNTVDNVQLLCSKHNLEKRDKIE